MLLKPIFKVFSRHCVFGSLFKRDKWGFDIPALPPCLTIFLTFHIFLSNWPFSWCFSLHFSLSRWAISICFQKTYPLPSKITCVLFPIFRKPGFKNDYFFMFIFCSLKAAFLDSLSDTFFQNAHGLEDVIQFVFALLFLFFPITISCLLNLKNYQPPSFWGFLAFYWRTWIALFLCQFIFFAHSKQALLVLVYIDFSALQTPSFNLFSWLVERIQKEFKG